MSDRKIEALRNMALRGTKHEAEQAKVILERMNVEIQEEEPLESFPFTWKNEYEKTVFIQMLFMVFDTDDLPLYKRRGSASNKRFVRCTQSQREEIDLFWGLYRRALDEELSITTLAFIQKNDIFSSDCLTAEPRELTDKDKKMLERARGVDRVHIRKQVTAGGAA